MTPSSSMDFKASFLLQNVRKHLLVHWKVMCVAIGISLLVVALAPVPVLILAAVMHIVLDTGGADAVAPAAQSLWDLQPPWGFDLKLWSAFLNELSQQLILRWGKQALAVGLCMLFLAVSLITKCLTIASQYLLWKVRCRAAQSMSSDVFHHVCNLSMDFFDRNRVGELISRVSGDAYQLGKYLYNIVTALLQSLPMAFLFWLILFQTNLKFTVIVILVSSLTIASTYYIGKKMRRLIAGANNTLGDMGAFMQETFSGMAVVKAYGAESYEQQRFTSSLAENFRYTVLLGALERMNKPIEDMIYSVSLVLIVIYSLSLVLSGAMPTEALVLYVYILTKVRAPTSDLFGVITDVQSALGAANKVFFIMQERSNVAEGGRDPDAFSHEIMFHNVSFKYNGSDDYVLRNIDLTIARGEVVAIVGSSGAGKSTLANLLLRFYDPTEGAILIDGEDIRQFRQRTYRHFFGVVTQETILFNATVRDNIAYGRVHDDVGDDDIVSAARAANAHDFIREMEKGYATSIGDRGTRLSGGQCQRLAIARAILRDPQILIFDEATSSLDSESERLVQEAIDRLLHGRTAVIIAHRLSTVINADKIVVLDQGRIIDMGRHIELLQRCALYQRLCRLQFHLEPPGTVAGSQDEKAS